MGKRSQGKGKKKKRSTRGATGNKPVADKSIDEKKKVENLMECIDLDAPHIYDIGMRVNCPYLDVDMDDSMYTTGTVVGHNVRNGKTNMINMMYLMMFLCISCAHNFSYLNMY